MAISVESKYIGFAVANIFVCQQAKACEFKNGFERALNHNVDVKRMKDTEDTTMPDPIARKRLKKKMLDRWENEGGSIATDTTGADASRPTGEDKGHSRKRSSPSDNSSVSARASSAKRRKPAQK